MPNNEEKHKEIEESVILKGYGLFIFERRLRLWLKQ